MPKVQVRNLDEDIYALLEASARKNERSLEGEMRYALRSYYQPPVREMKLSFRECWQQETGGRLLQLFDHLAADGLLRGQACAGKTSVAGWVQIAGQMEICPGLLMDCIEGRRELTSTLAGDIATRFSANADWLLTGRDTPFPVLEIGGEVSMDDFFSPQDCADWQLTLIRIAGERLHRGKMLCIRHHPDSGQYQCGTPLRFMLATGAGSSKSELAAFFCYLKSHYNQLLPVSFTWEAGESGYEPGRHHPAYYLNPNNSEKSDWLMRIMEGKQPGSWLDDIDHELQEIATFPFNQYSDD